MSPNIVMLAIIYVLACTASLAATAPTLGPYGEVITPNGTVWGLKDAFNGTFKTGVSFVRHSQLWKDPEALLIKENFNVLIPETDLTWGKVEVSEGEYDFSFVDDYLHFCEMYNIEPIGHCMVWKGIGWMSEVPENTTDSQRTEIYLNRIENYIKTMMGRYKDRIKRWVVVNEFFNNTGQIRDDFIFIKTLGKIGIEKSFRWAMQYGGPGVKLYHSEHNIWNYTKIQPVASFLTELRSKGVRIDGVFFQGHQTQVCATVQEQRGNRTVNLTCYDLYDRSIKLLGENKFPVVLSEIDISVLPWGWTCCRDTDLSDFPEKRQQELNPYVDGMTLQVAQQQRDKYVNFIKMLLRNKQYITDIHFWSVSDKSSWFNKWPIRGRTDYPTLFDRNHMPKPQYYDILRLAPNQPPNGTVIPWQPTETKR